MKNLLFVVLLSSISTLAFAQSWYGGGGISTLNSELSNSETNDTPAAQPIALNFFIGSKFNSYVGIEAFGALGIIDDDVEENFYYRRDVDFGFDFELDSMVGASVIGYIPLSEIVSLYAKLGYADVRYDDSDNDASSADGALFGFGAEFNFVNDIGMRVDIVKYPDGEYDDFDTDVETFALNVGVQFVF